MKKYKHKYIRKYKYMSQVTGELIPDFWSVIKTIYSDFKTFGIINLKWKYKRDGF
jgi:hypothetical protein